jgi:arginyl-tRNA--protein-N-Asp/Glu arginylyltransferase
MADTPFGKFPYQFAQHIHRQYWDGVQPNHRTALVVDSRAVSYDKETHDLLKRHGFRHNGRKWYRIDEPCTALSAMAVAESGLDHVGD